MADEPAKTPIQNKYAQQYADDLAANRKEQGNLTAQIAGLQERLEQLKAEEDWLTQAQGSLPEVPAPSVSQAQPAAAEAEASAPAETIADATQAVPPQRQDEPVKGGQPRKPAKKTASKKAAKATARKTTAKTTAKRTVKKAAAKKTTAKEAPAQSAAAAEAPADTAAAEEKSGPPLWQLTLKILLKTPGQPCVVREVHDQLAQLHPNRATSIQTVRNNLEILVKKGLAEKSTQRRNTMYTASVDTDADATPAADGETGQAPEAAAEKVPAEV
ncbi:BlaI/MecI/CopY family transcriptional regulator [Streptomyces sp. HK10]|uniref:BlaI/MecI/CopY family transcriptional regulator n=1 Tax=Streptomyces sp. HK10 TaxID=3373255 RepID=UPI00374A2B8F